jgi:hypothetical protein
MNGAIVAVRGATQSVEVELIVLCFEEHSLPIDTTLNHVLRYVRDEVSGLTWHPTWPCSVSAK